MELSLIVPFRNVGSTHLPFFRELTNSLAQVGITYEILGVDSGSQDSSADLLEAANLSNVKVLRAADIGKGNTVRTGFNQAQGDIVGFVDGDGDVPVPFVLYALSVMRAVKPDGVIASKTHPASVVSAPPLRMAYSWGYQTLVALLFNLPIRDTQVGLKLFSAKALSAVLPSLQEQRYALDIEILVALSKQGYTNLVEVPVNIDRTEPGLTNVSLSSVWRTFWDTIRIFKRYQ